MKRTAIKTPRPQTPLSPAYPPDRPVIHNTLFCFCCSTFPRDTSHHSPKNPTPPQITQKLHLCGNRRYRQARNRTSASNGSGYSMRRPAVSNGRYMLVFSHVFAMEATQLCTKDALSICELSYSNNILKQSVADEAQT